MIHELKNTTLYFDMDGTLFDLYSVTDWLPKLRAEDASPYIEAAPLVDFRELANLLNTLQNAGMKIGVISWLSKDSTKTYKASVRTAKRTALKRIPIRFDEIHLVQYGTSKRAIAKGQRKILFDDNDEVLENWRSGSKGTYIAIDVKADNILEVLQDFIDMWVA